MKNKILLLLVLLLAGSAGVYAQQGGGFQRRTVEERVKMTVEKLSPALSLNKDQQTQLEAAYTTYYKGMDGLRLGGDRPDRSAFEKLATERDEKVKGFLDEGQYKKYQEQLEAIKQQRREGRNGGGRGKGDTTPPSTK
ncbi:hypothetical protein KTO58_17060 [Chitinophaga pendula]|uniref:hypothetical protein n=1 Tax=Chitinophaga TaxID=79328 RepID=UPI000BAE70F7|nr:MULTISPECIES: hypothetical protein [Chitinophaga]ASZ11590.1 hypothetical protein CK934_11785 [Chitinophaga sp. MD30]UCJ05400.1 hypothetical protein KTO58_17060 [Chitinophaga pendula]